MNFLLGFKVFDKTIDDIDLRNNRIINTINPHSYCTTKIDENFKYVLQNSDILLPDGIGIVWASKVLNKKKIKKIAGFDIFIHLMNHLNAVNGSCFFLGAAEETLKLIKDRIKKEYPNVEVNSYSPPYKQEFSSEDSAKMIEAVNACKPTVLFVGMTAPKQEKWAFENKDKLITDIICSIGAVFDFYAGTIKRPGSFWIKMGLEWLPRFLKEPKRLAERNLVSTPKFIFEVLKHKLRISR
ncbi:WecB/TagA/CpsF family glycosyltransferase [Aquimarina addita]|uniref:WecB/TagA/CpsF family glycosyltransferase n=1 Tax=Aquimarina addita TaxID=870485 RepID=A0ABP6UMD9_9FLAO